jgi:hypothetical protein
MDINFGIRMFKKDDIQDVVQLSLLAWEPVFLAWERILGAEIYPLAIGPDWRKNQKEVVEKYTQGEKITT